MRAAVLAALLACTMAPAAGDSVPYPDGFREWVHVKSAVITPSHAAYKTEGDLHHIYANKAAVDGYRSGTFADGAVIAYELLETREAAGLVSEGPRRRLDVMVRDRARYADTGGWGFERFLGDSQTDRAVRDQAATMCFSCHAKQKARDFVFSRIRE